MYKLFSPKDYTFLGLVFGLPTALYASVRNGLALKETHPEVLRQTRRFVWAFIVLFLVSVIADIAALHLGIIRIREAYAHSDWLDDSGLLGQSIRAVRDNLSLISWAFIISQLVTLVVFVKKSRKIELPIYESLKQSQQMGPRSNVELVVVGIGVWVAFWLYGQLVAKIMMTLIQ